MKMQKEYEILVKSLLQSRVPSDSKSLDVFGHVPNKRRIYFSRIGMDGLSDLHEYSVIPKFFNHLEFKENTTIEETSDYLKKLLSRESKGNTAYWFIRLLNSQKIIGTLGLIDIDYNKRTGEVGKGLSPKYWGKGYMSEAFSIYINYCFNVLELDRLWSVTSHENHANIRLMKKFGFNMERRLKDFYHKHDGSDYDAVLLGQYRKNYIEIGRV